jgi:hypothetical protein
MSAAFSAWRWRCAATLPPLLLASAVKASLAVLVLYYHRR